MSEADNRIQCAALTRVGQPCKNLALPGSNYCRVHQSQEPDQGEDADEQYSEQDYVSPRASRRDRSSLNEDLRRQFMRELDAMIERLQATRPEYTPPPFSPRGVIDLVEENLDKLSSEAGLRMLQRLRRTIGEDIFDLDTWKGTWYMLNYTLEYQADIVKRRLTGEFETDEWGLDWEVIEAVQPFLEFLYHQYWRVEILGLENIPASGRALLVVNHSGQLPWDGIMLGFGVLNEHPAQRLVRTLYATWFATIPFFSAMLPKLGQVLDTEENGVRLLQGGELVAVYPEGSNGIGKLFKDRYRLARFGQGGFVRMALKTKAPLITVSIVGAEETFISLAKSTTMARLFGFPYFPISPTWPWFGPFGLIPLPTKWYIDIGEPIPMDRFGPEAEYDHLLVSKLTDQIRSIVQNMIFERLEQRKSVFFG